MTNLRSLSFILVFLNLAPILWFLYNLGMRKFQRVISIRKLARGDRATVYLLNIIEHFANTRRIRRWAIISPITPTRKTE